MTLIKSSVYQVRISGKRIGVFRLTDWGWDQATFLLDKEFDTYDIYTALPNTRQKVLGLNSLRVILRELILQKIEKMDWKADDWDRLTGP